MRTLMVSGLLLTLVGCAHCVAADEPVVKVFKSRGSVQCGGNGVPPEEMQNTLLDAGVGVKRVACGNDGRMRVAMCNAGDGRINIFEIPQSRLKAAQNLGFAVLSEHARETPCQSAAGGLRLDQR